MKGLLAGLAALLLSFPASGSPPSLDGLAPGARVDALHAFVDCDGYCGLKPGSFEYAEAKSLQCDTPTAWATQVAPGVWVAECGDQEGFDSENSCSEKAALHWHMSGGRDSAYEDALSQCYAEEPVTGSR